MKYCDYRHREQNTRPVIWLVISQETCDHEADNASYHTEGFPGTVQTVGGKRHNYATSPPGKMQTHAVILVVPSSPRNWKLLMVPLQESPVKSARFCVFRNNSVKWVPSFTKRIRIVSNGLLKRVSQTRKCWHGFPKEITDGRFILIFPSTVPRMGGQMTRHIQIPECTDTLLGTLVCSPSARV